MGNFNNNKRSFGHSSNGRSFGSSSNRSRFSNRRSNGNGRRKREGYKFDENMFVKKAEPIQEQTKYKSNLEFQNLNVDAILQRNIQAKNFDTPTPIQDQSIVNIMEGKDLLGVADTGTGKTAAFLVPLIDKAVKNKNSRILIMTPTRELAEQINKELRTLTRGMQVYSVQCIGGSNIRNQIYNLERGFSFVIGTPGRLKDLFDRRVLNLAGFDTVVLDEVDRMLDMGFVHEIKHLISFLPEDRQSLCFSATVDKKVEYIIDAILKKDYVKISVKTGETAKNVDQNIVRIERHEDKMSKLTELLNAEGFDKVLVFANTKREVDRLDKLLYQKGFKVESIHGEKRQNKRKQSIESFKSGRSRILVATDVASRGLDISGITHVINYDIPMNYEDYIHRVGRTGRANMMGQALTFVERKSYRR